jgi:hypothetical protein
VALDIEVNGGGAAVVVSCGVGEGGSGTAQRNAEKGPGYRHHPGHGRGRWCSAVQRRGGGPGAWAAVGRLAWA